MKNTFNLKIITGAFALFGLTLFVTTFYNYSKEVGYFPPEKSQLAQVVSSTYYTLTVTTYGNNQGGANSYGTVTSNPSGIFCGASGTTCSKGFAPGTQITLYATALQKPSSVFFGWGGSCSGNSPSCSFVMPSYNVSVSAMFNLAGQQGTDTTPPTISSASGGTPSQNATTIRWVTNENSDSQVEYGLTSSYGNYSSLNYSLGTSHSVNLSNLSSNTTYHYRVRSRDAAGNLTSSSDQTFRTASPSQMTTSSLGGQSCSPLTPLDLTENATNEIDGRISGLSAATSLTLFSVKGTTASSTWVRNSQVWSNFGAEPIDWTGLAGWNSNGGYQMAVTLISPRHFVAAHHFYPAVGSRVVFIDNNNVAYERMVVGIADIPYNIPSGNVSDAEVGVLDSDLPDSIAFYPIMSDEDLHDRLQQVDPQTIDVPIAIFDQEKKALIHSLTTENFYDAILHHPYTSGPRSQFSEEMIGGDSGNPSFIIANGQPVLLATETTGGGGPNYGSYIDKINQAIDQMGNSGGYHVSVYDPSCFIEYPVDTAPVFTGRSNYTIITYKHFPSDIPVTNLEAQDVDQGQSISFSLTGLRSVTNNLTLNPSDYFSINSSTGQLFQTHDFDFSQVGLNLELTAKITDNGIYHASSTKTIPIKLLNAVYAPNLHTVILDPSFSLPITDGTVKSVDFQSDGNMVMGGSFNRVNNTDSSGVARVNSSGALDTNFSSSIGSGATITGGEKSVDKVVVNPTGKIIIEGSIDRFNGTTVGKVAALNSDGSLDSTFSNGTDGSIQDVFSDSSGILVTAYNPTYNGSTVGKLFSLNPNGVLDNNFANNFSSPGFVPTSVTGLSIVKLGGKIYVGGSLLAYKGPDAVTHLSNRIAAFNTDGSFNSNFTTTIGSGFNGSVYALSVTPSGKIVAVGSFSQFNGHPAPHIALLNADGTLDSNFMSNLGTGFDDNLNAVAVQSDGKILVGGLAYTFNNKVPGRLFRFNPDGTLDSAFQGGVGNGFAGSISKIAVRPDGDIAVLGELSDYDGTTLQNTFAILKTVALGDVSNPPQSSGSGGVSFGGGSSNPPPQSTNCPPGFVCVANPGTPPTNPATPTTSFNFTRDLTLGSRGDDVVALQNFLISGTYLEAGNNTGFFGNLTQAALIKYQRAKGISPAAGYFGSKSRTFIMGASIPSNPTPPSGGSFYRDLTLGSRGADVTALQNILISQGYLGAGNNTGFFGQLTQSALISYQRAHGINPTGYFGPLTRASINSGTAAVHTPSAPTPPSVTPTPPSTPTPPAVVFTLDLSLGSRNSEVLALQRFLISNNYLLQSNDSGYFDSATESAVGRFQLATGVVTSANAVNYGKVDSYTRVKLNMATGN